MTWQPSCNLSLAAAVATAEATTAELAALKEELAEQEAAASAAVANAEAASAEVAALRDAAAAAEEEAAAAREAAVGRCRLTVSKPVLKAPMVSALETIIS